MDKLIREARKAGFEVGRQGTWWKVTNPLTSESVLLIRSPTNGHGMSNERAKLRRIGFTPGETDLRVRTDEPNEPEQPAPLEPPDPRDEPAAEAAEREGNAMPEISETVRITGKGRNVRDDLPTNSWLLWTAIHENEPTEPHELDGVDGALWRGSLNSKINDMLPGLPKQDTDSRNAINRYLRATGNMICLKRESRPPLWWLSKTWIEDKPDLPAQVVPTRTERRLSRQEAGEDRTPAPVAVSTITDATEKRANSDVDPLAAITEIVDRVRELEKLNLELDHANEALTRENSELKQQLSRIKQAFRDLSA